MVCTLFSVQIHIFTRTRFQNNDLEQTGFVLEVALGRFVRCIARIHTLNVAVLHQLLHLVLAHHLA